MLPNPYGPYARKEVSPGVYGRPDVGMPSWDSELVAAFPGRAFLTCANGAEVCVDFDDPPLTQAEIDGPLQASYDAWVPWDPVAHKTAKIADLDQEALLFLQGVIRAQGIRMDPVRFRTTLQGYLVQSAILADAARVNHVMEAARWYDSAIDQLVAATVATQGAATPAAVDAVSIDWDAWLAANPWPGVTALTIKAIPPSQGAIGQTEAPAEQQDTVGTFVPALVATIPDQGEPYTWRVAWSAVIRTDAGAGRGCEARAQLDDGGAPQTWTTLQTATAYPALTDTVGPVWAVDRRVLSGEVHVTRSGQVQLQIEFRRSGTAGAAFVEDCRISWERIG